MKIKQTQPGFTIVELVVVIVIIAILAIAVVTTYFGIQSRAKIHSVNSDLHNIKNALLLYRAEMGSMPNGDDWYSGVTMPPSSRWATEIIANLKALNYIQTDGLDKDPWGQYYFYDNNDCTFGQGGASYVKSVGPDGALSTGDDITIQIPTTC